MIDAKVSPLIAVAFGVSCGICAASVMLLLLAFVVPYEQPHYVVAGSIPLVVLLGGLGGFVFGSRFERRRPS